MAYTITNTYICSYSPSRSERWNFVFGSLIVRQIEVPREKADILRYRADALRRPPTSTDGEALVGRTQGVEVREANIFDVMVTYVLQFVFKPTVSHGPPRCSLLIQIRLDPLGLHAASGHVTRGRPLA